MADISDISATLLALAGAALYPVPPAADDGYALSVVGLPVRLYEGWPLPALLDADLKGLDADGNVLKAGETGNAIPVMHVTVYPGPTQAASASVAQIFEPPVVVVPAVHGLTAVVSDDQTRLTLTGTPSDSEYVTVVVDNRAIYSRVGVTATAILDALLADVLADFPSATLSGSTLIIPGAHEMVVKLGAKARMSQILHRQRQRVVIIIWAPDNAARNAAATAIDVALKQNLRLTLPDASQAILTYDSTFVTDHWETVGVYRRDLTFSAEFATTETFDAYEVTAVGAVVAPTQFPIAATTVPLTTPLSPVRVLLPTAPNTLH